jgi:hypothetical protein
MSENNLPQREKFLFIFPTQKVTKKCCCCSLRLGVFILSMILLILNIALLIINSYHYYYHYAAIRIIIDIIRIVGSILLLISLKNENSKYATVSNIIFTILFFIHIIFNMSFLYMLSFHYNHTNLIGKLIISLVVISFLLLECWLNWIIFSYTKLLKYRQTDVIKGKPDNVDFSYKNVPNSSSINV